MPGCPASCQRCSCQAAHHELHRYYTPPAVQGTSLRELHALDTICIQRTTSCHDQRNSSCSYTRATTRVTQSRPMVALKLITGSMQVMKRYPLASCPPPSIYMFKSYLSIHAQLVDTLSLGGAWVHEPYAHVL